MTLVVPASSESLLSDPSLGERDRCESAPAHEADEVSGVHASATTAGPAQHTPSQHRPAHQAPGRGLGNELSDTSYEAKAFGDVRPKGPCVGLPDEMDRVRLIGELSRILHEPSVPEPMRHAGLMLIGWLARRMPGESSHSLGVERCVGERCAGEHGVKRSKRS